jgi:hypothetical protein
MVANLTTRLGQLTSSPAGGPYTGANKIINGDMRIDQRSAGASSTPTVDGTYTTVDRWDPRLSVTSKYSLQQITDGTFAAFGAGTSLKVTSLSAYTPGAAEFFAIETNIEANNLQDLQYGTASAQSVTISLLMKVSVAGTYGIIVYNPSAAYTYVFSTVLAANTATLVTQIIPGDTAHALATGNANGLRLSISLGAGASVSGATGSWLSGAIRSATGAVALVATNAATMYFTNVKLELDTVATPFVSDDYQVSLSKCQRYYENSFAPGTAVANGQAGVYFLGSAPNTGTVLPTVYYKVQKRATPTIAFYRASNGATNGMWAAYASGFVDATSMAIDTSGTKGFGADLVRSAAFTLNGCYTVDGNWTADAEL